MKRIILISSIFALAAAISACGDDHDHDHEGHNHNQEATFPLIGTWTSNFGSTEVITSTSWNGSRLVEFDADAFVAYTQNPADASFGPNEFNKIEWIGLTDNSFYYCFVDFGLATLDAAKSSTQTADASDPDNSGCGGFGWTKLAK